LKHDLVSSEGEEFLAGFAAYNAPGSEGIPAREQFEAQTQILQTIAKFSENYYDVKTLGNPVEFDHIMESLFVTNNAELSHSARSELNAIHEDIFKKLPVIKFID